MYLCCAIKQWYPLHLVKTTREVNLEFIFDVLLVVKRNGVADVFGEIFEGVFSLLLGYLLIRSVFG